MASGRRKCPRRRKGAAANGRPAGPGAPTRPLSSARPFPGRPRLSPRDPEVLAAVPAGGPHLPLQTEAAPALPSHIGQGRAACSPPRPPDRTIPGPRAPPPAAAPALPFICGSRCHKMALREDARPRRPTPFPLLPPRRAAPPRPAPPAARPGPTAPQPSPALVAAPPCSRPAHSPSRLLDAAAATSPSLGPAAGKKGEGTAPARNLRALRKELRLGGTPRRFGALQIRRGRGEKRVARRGGRQGRRSAAGHHGKGGGGRDWRRRADALAGPPAAAAQPLAEESRPGGE